MIAGFHGKSMLLLLRAVFQSDCTILNSHQQVNESFYCPTSSPALSVVSVLDFGHSNRCVAVIHCCFDLHFSDAIGCGASFHMLIFYLYIFYDEVSSKSLTHFFFFFFLAVLGLRFCARAFSSCGKRGPLFIAVRGPLTIVASRCGAQAPDAQAQ